MMLQSGEFREYFANKATLLDLLLQEILDGVNEPGIQYECKDAFISYMLLEVFKIRNKNKSPCMQM